MSTDQVMSDREIVRSVSQSPEDLIGWLSEGDVAAIQRNPGLPPEDTWSVAVQWSCHGGAPEVIELKIGADAPTWVLDALNTFQELLELPPNWNGYGGRPVTGVAVVEALKVLAAFASNVEEAPAIVPTGRGGLQIEWHMNDLDLEISISPNGRITVGWDDNRTGTQWDGDLLENLERVEAMMVRLRVA